MTQAVTHAPVRQSTEQKSCTDQNFSSPSNHFQLSPRLRHQQSSSLTPASVNNIPHCKVKSKNKVRFKCYQAID